MPYFHVAFTVPAEVAAIAFQNKAVVYAILFEAVAATLKTIAADPTQNHVAVAVGVNTLSKAIMAGSAGNKMIGGYVGGASALALIAGFAAMTLG